MKKQTGNKFKLALFVLLGIFFLIVSVYYVGKKQQLFNKTFRVSGIFKDISGLQVGNNVRFSGITIGVVENISMVADTAVQVDLCIDEDIRKFIKKDAIATIGTDGLMGSKIVVIGPGTAGKTEIQNSAFLATAVSVSMDDILIKLKQTADNAATITGDLSLITESIRDGKGTVGKLLMDSVFAKSIDQTLVNIRQAAGGFKQNMDAAGHNILLRGYLKKKEKEKSASR